MNWRHSLVDLDSKVQAVCRLPEMLAVVGELIGERFFLSQVEGREPLLGGGHQALHRDLSAQRPGDSVNALAYLDDYGAKNGALRGIPPMPLRANSTNSPTKLEIIEIIYTHFPLS